MQESIYIFILHCRILTSPGAKRGAEAFENGFSWIPGQWSCRHTHTIISTLFEIYMFFHRSKSLSEQSEPLCCTYWKTLIGFNTSYIQYVSMTVTVSIGLTSWMQSVCLVAVVQAFLFDTQPATLFPCLESDVLIRFQCQGTGVLGGRTRLGCFASKELLGGRTR